MAEDDEHVLGATFVSDQWDNGVLVSCNRRDLLTYALGIGCSDLHYVYEGHADFAAFPTYPVVLGFKGDATDVVTFPSPAMMEGPFIQLPGANFFLDAERYIEMVRPLPADGGSFTLKSRIAGVHKVCLPQSLAERASGGGR